ncbi:tRNA (uridine(54)-C5)-methyltransferase TrmA [Poseidonibacter ostreae]|jgi:tRNA (uracil-5-)-methyltransferase|uniref:tRNA (Uridine(54)-C5)-methyltransferase TrmA n=1 Tax=Poseidonibacter ostreae TaxID=2654171 RepID=A0A6L4WTE1_9BACT|nr:tRNA (uridine(54)-C5)-methyltransferase TrmA [Poseidonibacter ostreae]KAB7886693.1 tRNA (uridine(54)-C5)-methyltransferase TrmA [Poseidonibacter ostreae]KAB7889085.1 tRNA (uridine(54)-C5)-methyltransferase TrmA [Poseidonibacter ostreae]KAB7891776.1 tRNA (uridine(54)-C5)-methyltransferase TrmA [Poseidonibacter ostreae]
MNCEYFGKCGSCTIHDIGYEGQLDLKIQREKERFSNFTDLENVDFDIVRGDEQNFRNRAEFKIWKNFDENDNPTLSYAMTSIDKTVLEISSCQIVSLDISNLMPKLLEEIQKNKTLSFKLFAIEFLNSTTGDMLVTLIYHRKLDEDWNELAKELSNKFNIKIIGRSRKQKVILENDYIDEKLNINNTNYNFRYIEGGFTQPNTKVNIGMIEWVLNNIKDSSKDLCELYCGGGNFTIPLSSKFRKVLATEISKTSIKSAKTNCELNNNNKIEFIRMSAEEFVEALEEKRVFSRLKDVDLKAYDFDSIFVDPPRAGLDDTTRALVKNFEQIIYVSCNPETLHRDLEELTKTHTIENFALFDQFSYTHHIESGVILKKK